MLQATFCPFAVSSIPADQVRRGLEPDVDLSREGLAEGILYGRALLPRQVKSAAHKRGARRCLNGLERGVLSPGHPWRASDE